MLKLNSLIYYFRRQVSFIEAEQFAEEENIFFFECSAKTSYGLNEVFFNAANHVYSRLENKEFYSEEEVYN